MEDHVKDLMRINQNINLMKGHINLHASPDMADAWRYHSLIHVQGEVEADVRMWYQVHYKEAQKSKKEGESSYILQKDKYCTSPQNQT